MRQAPLPCMSDTFLCFALTNIILVDIILTAANIDLGLGSGPSVPAAAFVGAVKGGP